MEIQKKLNAEELACQIAYSHDLLDKRFDEGWERRRALSNWRLEIFEWIKQADREELNFVLNFLKEEYQVAYLEVLSMTTEFHKELNELKQNNKDIDFGLKTFFFVDGIIDRIIKKVTSLIRKEEINEEVRSYSSLCIGRSCDDYGDSGPTESSGPVHN